MKQNIFLTIYSALQRTYTGVKRAGVAAILIALFISCDLQFTEDEELKPASQTELMRNNLDASSSQIAIMMAQINLTVSPQATGTITLELRNQLGDHIHYATRSVSEMASRGIPTWYSFHFYTAHLFPPQTPLRLYIRRSDNHNEATGNTVFISTSSGNDYVDGNSSIPNKDISFITYKKLEGKHLVDQRQTRVRETQPITNNGYVWQEFNFGDSTSDSQVGILTTISLQISNPMVQPGTFSISIMNAQGTVTAEEVVIPASQIPVNSTPWTDIRLPNPLIVSIGQKYRLQFRHNTSSDINPLAIGHAFHDEYPYGSSSISSDFAFKTFLEHRVDQTQQTSNIFLLIPGNTNYWQEFVPGARP